MWTQRAKCSVAAWIEVPTLSEMWGDGMEILNWKQGSFKKKYFSLIKSPFKTNTWALVTAGNTASFRLKNQPAATPFPYFCIMNMVRMVEVGLFNYHAELVDLQSVKKTKTIHTCVWEEGAGRRPTPEKPQTWLQLHHRWLEKTKLCDGGKSTPPPPTHPIPLAQMYWNTSVSNNRRPNANYSFGFISFVEFDFLWFKWLQISGVWK